MRGEHGRWTRVRSAAARALPVLLTAVVLSVVVACGAEPPPSVAVPSFATPGSTAADPGAVGPVVGLGPADCVGVLAPADLGALLGLPLESVDVRTTVGVPQPSVGRIERMSCRYTGRGPDAGRTLLAVRLAAYTDPQAAARQWQINVDAEDGTPRDNPLGSAPGVLVQRPGETVLTVVDQANVLTLTRTNGALPSGRSEAELLVDLALRMLPAMAGRPVVPGSAPAPVAPADGGTTEEPERAPDGVQAAVTGSPGGGR